ncbi:uncharacterized protein FIESC28_01256 [Fusarium coffeatum]|uniref:Uncharacterized protein n=1 Tax=Fusarium coffeatum TaxID=231269 RepID=A0A366S9H4_9HYPO|nr:uncharacterized protein FIESC28_01256 [Fusarium coffeatum]RBR25983.1 hypothetical protein FIESC28_01256 [Fusarium coffeatum]
MSTTNDPMRETTVRPSQQGLENILQGVQGVETRLKGINTQLCKILETTKGITAKLDKTIEKVEEIDANLGKTLETLKGIDTKVEGLDKQLRDSFQAIGAKCDERFDEFDKKLDQLGNFIAIFTAAPNTTFERAKL